MIVVESSPITPPGLTSRKLQPSWPLLPIKVDFVSSTEAHLRCLAPFRIIYFRRRRLAPV